MIEDYISRVDRIYSLDLNALAVLMNLPKGQTIVKVRTWSSQETMGKSDSIEVVTEEKPSKEKK